MRKGREETNYESIIFPKQQKFVGCTVTTVHLGNGGKDNRVQTYGLSKGRRKWKPTTPGYLPGHNCRDARHLGESPYLSMRISIPEGKKKKGEDRAGNRKLEAHSSVILLSPENGCQRVGDEAFLQYRTKRKVSPSSPSARVARRILSGKGNYHEKKRGGDERNKNLWVLGKIQFDQKDVLLMTEKTFAREDSGSVRKERCERGGRESMKESDAADELIQLYTS